mmetsp:Transcript_25280/g.29158  ORF Transcript_25280/g.29158 Transcript_25280/m.29158 type:complete len:144 (+) Transcript_25280:186-617(+)
MVDKNCRILRINQFFNKRKRIVSPRTVKNVKRRVLSPTILSGFRSPLIDKPIVKISPNDFCRNTSKLSLTEWDDDQIKMLSDLKKKVDEAKQARFAGFKSPVVLPRTLWQTRRASIRRGEEWYNEKMNVSNKELFNIGNISLV